VRDVRFLRQDTIPSLASGTPRWSSPRAPRRT